MLSEPEVMEVLQSIVNRLAPDRFEVRERKNLGSSVLRKPADLEIRQNSGTRRPLIAVEIADLNTTQLVGAVVRLFFDTCAIKLLIVGNQNASLHGTAQCEQLFARLYGQDDIQNAPARVAAFTDHASIEKALNDLLFL
jgi:hypothetical protein